MSAFVVGKAHIDAMIRAALTVRDSVSWFVEAENPQDRWHKLDYTNVDEVGQMLLDENVTSVRYRYEGSSLTDLPGRVDADYLLPYRFRNRGRIPTPVEALKLVSCYEYQSCEHPEWKSSEAKRFCDAFRDAMINRLPGYEEAPWEWEEEAVKV